ncbi:MAG: nucleoside deaminase [Deltaproteobacteria bacterium]|nr:nucleoside deaminase [Deltaproteobacteria bacterium]
MDQALAEARVALDRGEVPVGAVIVWEGRVVARAHNLREARADPLAHAECLAIAGAAEQLGRWRLDAATLVVTLEPCLMCMGALLQARIPRLVYGAADPKAGAAGTLYDLSDDPRLNHRVDVQRGVRAGEASRLLKAFFEGRRRAGAVPEEIARRGGRVVEGG